MSSVETLTSKPGKVAVGSTVEVEWDDGQRGVYEIGSESDLAQNVIAPDAPLARAIRGASEGDVRTYLAGRSRRTVTVIRVDGAPFAA